MLALGLDGLGLPGVGSETPLAMIFKEQSTKYYRGMPYPETERKFLSRLPSGLKDDPRQYLAEVGPIPYRLIKGLCKHEPGEAQSLSWRTQRMAVGATGNSRRV